MMNRRRFLTLAAASLASPARAIEASWSGAGFGTALSIRLSGVDPLQARRTFHRVEAEIARIEDLFSLYRDSALVRLNRDGRLSHPSPAMLDILGLCGRVHDATEGAFDPTVQPIWLALARGTAAPRAVVGFNRVRIAPEEIRLDKGQALTLNGVAQGWAADRIAGLLRRQGFAIGLVDLGEIAALGPAAGTTPWTAAIQSPGGMTLGKIPLRDRCLATSSPRGTLVGGAPHIIGPQGQAPRWSTVSVSAPSAAVADALSTAFCLMPESTILRALSAFPRARLEHLS